MKKILIILLLIITVINGLSFNVSAVSVPGKISKLKLTKTCSTAINVKWSKSSGATKYLVHLKVSGGKYSKIADTFSKSCVASSLKKNKKYTFKVTPYTKNNGSKIYGKSKTKTINLKKAKTITPRLTKSVCKGIIRCVARTGNMRAYVDFDSESIPPTNIGWYSSRYYWLVTTKGLNTVKAARIRMRKYMSSSFYDYLVEEQYLATYNGRLYIYANATDDMFDYDLNSIEIGAKNNGYYNVYYNRYYGFIGYKTAYFDVMKVKFIDGYYKCCSIKNIGSRFEGYVPSNSDMVW